MKQTQAPYPPYADWWHDGALLRRFVSDFMHAELIMMRRGGAGLPSLPWPEGLQLEADLGVDSLERYALATALSACLHLHESGADQALLGCTTLEQWIACAANGLDHYSAEMSFKTSGSSGVPKCCPHKLDMLWQEACFFAAQLAHPRRVIYTVPAHHIYGFLFSVLLPLACGPVRAALVDARNMLPMELIAQATDGDAIIGYPEFWSAVARHAPIWPSGVTGVTSTAPCLRDVALQLTASGLCMVEVYGSSENAGMGWRTDARRPYVLLPHWRRAASGDSLVRQAPDGTELRCDCQDQIDWQGENSFVPVGRRDQAVQVGGTNVYPAQVAEMLKRHPGVSEAHVRLMRADEGQRLKAFVVAEHFGAAERLPDQLASWVRERLPPAARPVSFTVGAALPVNRQGKLSDWIISDGPGTDGA